MLDLRRCHWWSVLSDHLGKVLRESIDLLLEQEKGGLKGTQLPFINNKGEFIHLIINASKDKLQRHHSLRQKQGKSSKCRGIDPSPQHARLEGDGPAESRLLQRSFCYFSQASTV